MAEGGGTEIVPIGLSLDTANLVRGTQQAVAALQGIGTATAASATSLASLEQKATQAGQGLAQLSSALQAQTQAQGQANQATTQLASAQLATAQATAQLAAATREQTAAYTQSAAAALASKQQQDALRDSLRQQREEARASADVWRQLFAVAGGVGLATSIGAIVGQMKAFGVSVVETGAKMETLRLSLAAVTGGQREGERAFVAIEAQASKLGLGIVGLTEGYKNFAAATQGTALAGAGMERVFQGVTVAGRVLGSSSEQTRSALLALEQMVSKGTVSMEELRRQLGNALPGAFQIAARAMGMTTMELTAFVKQGGENAIPFVKAFGEQLILEFGGKAESASHTATAAFEKFSNEMILMKERLAGSGFLAILSGMAESAAKLLEADRKAAEARKRDLGPAPALPSVAAGGGTPEALGLNKAILIQRDVVDQLLKDKQQLGEALGPNFDKALRKAQSDLQVLEEALKKFLAMQGVAREAEGEPLASASEHPLSKAEDKLKKLLEEGKKNLAKIDLDAQLIPSLNAAEEKLKSWDKTIKSIRDELGRLSEPFRQQLSGTGAIPTVRAPGTERWRPLIAQLTAGTPVPPALVEAVMMQESGGNPHALGKGGETGLMQILPSTGARIPGFAGHEYEPEANIKAGVFLLGQLLGQFSGDLKSVIAAYNAGPGHGGVPQPGGNQDYVNKVSGNLAWLQGPEGVRAPRGGIPRVLAEAVTQRAVLEAAVEAPDAAKKAAKEAEREAEHDAAERRRQAFSTGREQTRVADEEIAKQEADRASLEKLKRQFTLSPDARKEATALDIAARYPEQEGESALAKENRDLAQKVYLLGLIHEGQVAAKKDEKERGDAAEEAAKKEATALQRLANQGEQLQQQLADVQDSSPTGRSRRADVRALQLVRKEVSTPEGAQAAEAQLARNRATEDLIAQANKIKSASDAVADSFLSAIDRATTGGIKSFKDFASSVIQDLLRIANQQFLQPQLSKLIGAGIQAGKTALGGLGGGGSLTGDAATYNADAATAGFGTTARASGGAAYSETPYIVGEHGPESFIPAQNGRILSHDDAMQALRGHSSTQGQTVTNNITLNVHGVQDASSFIRSRGEVQRAALQALQQAQRAA